MSPSPLTTAVKLDKTDALETSPSFFLTISPLAETQYKNYDEKLYNCCRTCFSLNNMIYLPIYWIMFLPTRQNLLLIDYRLPKHF